MKSSSTKTVDRPRLLRKAVSARHKSKPRQTLFVKLLGNEEGQTAVEYLLVLGGAVFIVVAVIVLLRTQSLPAITEQIRENQENFTGILGMLSGRR
ncbi:MAG: hypothetical protein AABW54_03905 [Candidatus Micrarchaeota archaeon]